MKLEDIKTRTKDAVDYLVHSLESGQSEVLSEYLGAMARFHSYSFGNVMLIARQKPDATNIAGVRTWNSLGRFVKRGEKGILILAPMVGHRRSRQIQIAPDIDTDSVDDEPKPERQLIGFRAVYVFDHQPDRRQGTPHPHRSQWRRERIPRPPVQVRGIAKRPDQLLRANRSREGSLVWREDHAAIRDAARRGVFHART